MSLETAVRGDDEIGRKIRQIVAKQFNCDIREITDETSFLTDLSADSVDRMQLLVELEEAYDLAISDEAAEKIRTVGQTIDYIRRITVQDNNNLY